jgi:hypothetical protein
MEQNHGGGDEELHPAPEHREQLHINSIVIPAMDEEPLRQSQLAVANLDDYQKVVGGIVQAIDLERPPMRLYCNEEGKLHELPLNRRATVLLWGHNQSFRFRDQIVGDAFLVGPMGQRGLDANVPDEFVQFLFEAKTLQVDVLLEGNPDWQPSEVKFDNWLEAYAYALSMTHNWREAQDFRIVPEG